MKLSSEEMKAIEIINNTESAPVKVGFGWVGKDGICREGLVIYECAPIIIDRLKENGFSLSLSDGLLHVNKY